METYFQTSFIPDTRNDFFINFKKKKSLKFELSNMYNNFCNYSKPNRYSDINIQEDKTYENVDLLKMKCNKPITSYGIILYTYEKNKYLKYLICQRRDSIAYIQFLKDSIEEKDMKKYINLMTKEEKHRCLEYFYKKDPYTIWKDLWINDKSRIYKYEYKRCTDMFLKNMEKYIEIFLDESIGQNENSWGFPKGRLQDKENEIECALREFEEETNISQSLISVDKNISFEEIYIGSNNLLYKTVYYTAYIPFVPKKEYKYYPYNIRKKFVSPETYEFEWLEYKTATYRLNESKRSILSKINNFHLKKKF